MYGATTSPANQFGSNAAAAWAAGSIGSNTVYIGIIDEGVMNLHTDLVANMSGNPNEAADGADNDGNGLVDDTYGWDFVNNDKIIYDGTGDDHGTHVAGTIGGVGNNGTGVAGVCWTVQMLNAKFLGDNGGTTANAIKAVDYFTDLKKKGLNIVATSNSWGGGGYSQGLFDAIERANQAGILFIAAAGNGGWDGIGDDNDRTPHYPSSYNNLNIIAVASITSTGAKSGFSNYGKTSVDIGAPGSGIWSTLPDNKYGSYSGTSMATPHVSGAVALYAATKKLTPKTSVDAAAIRSAILNSAVVTSSLNTKRVSVATRGRLDANAALSR
jgi:subtilisin family serine protease